MLTRVNKPLHRPLSLDDVVVCSHCWDLTLVGAEGDPDIPDVVIWPCPTSVRTLDLLATQIDADLVYGVARTEHEIFEEDYEEEDREEFEDLVEDDRDFILYEAHVWLTALQRYAQSL